MKLKIKIISLIVTILITYLNTAYCEALATKYSFICQDTVGCGPTVKVEGNKVILDRSVIIKLAKKPSLEFLGKNLWEVVYFVSIADKDAMNAAIDIIAMIKSPSNIQIDDDNGIRPLARSLTQTTHFWDLLATKPLSIRKKVIQYYDVNKCDYTMSYDDYEGHKKEILEIDKK